jgi:hypothetical protein
VGKRSQDELEDSKCGVRKTEGRSEATKIMSDQTGDQTGATVRVVCVSFNDTHCQKIEITAALCADQLQIAK